MQNLRAIILTNQVKRTWPSSLGIPSNAVNILYVCYFLKLPKFNYLAPSRFFFFLQRQLIPDNFCSLLRQFKTCSSHFSFLLHPFSLSLFFLSLFFLGGGVGKASSINLGYKGGQPQIISNEQRGHHIQQELPVNFHHPP